MFVFHRKQREAYFFKEANGCSYVGEIAAQPLVICYLLFDKQLKTKNKQHSYPSCLRREIS